MIVSAVCFRRSPAGVEFLLVRTTGGDLWTFPKGHVEPGENPLAAAARESAEEAGAAGVVDPEPLGEYLYPGGSGPDQETPRKVMAFLLEVETQESPEENWRNPTWCSSEKARTMLAENRAELFGKEHDRILSAALGRLGE